MPGFYCADGSYMNTRAPNPSCCTNPGVLCRNCARLALNMPANNLFSYEESLAQSLGANTANANSYDPLDYDEVLPDCEPVVNAGVDTEFTQFHQMLKTVPRQAKAKILARAKAAALGLDMEDILPLPNEDISATDPEVISEPPEVPGEPPDPEDLDEPDDILPDGGASGYLGDAPGTRSAAQVFGIKPPPIKIRGVQGLRPSSGGGTPVTPGRGRPTYNSAADDDDILLLPGE